MGYRYRSIATNVNKQRMNAIENVFHHLKKEKREDIVNVLMWEIGKDHFYLR